MNRKTFQKREKNGGVRHMVVLESTSDCIPNTQEARYLQMQFLRTLLETPDLMTCGGILFERMNLYHDGRKWKAELEAYEPQNEENRYESRNTEKQQPPF